MNFARVTVAKNLRSVHGLLPLGNRAIKELGLVSANATSAEFKLSGLSGMNLQLVMQGEYKDTAC